MWKESSSGSLASGILGPPPMRIPARQPKPMGFVGDGGNNEERRRGPSNASISRPGTHLMGKSRGGVVKVGRVRHRRRGGFRWQEHSGDDETHSPSPVGDATECVTEWPGEGGAIGGSVSVAATLGTGAFASAATGQRSGHYSLGDCATLPSAADRIRRAQSPPELTNSALDSTNVEANDSGPESPLSELVSEDPSEPPLAIGQTQMASMESSLIDSLMSCISSSDESDSEADTTVVQAGDQGRPLRASAPPGQGSRDAVDTEAQTQNGHFMSACLKKPAGGVPDAHGPWEVAPISLVGRSPADMAAQGSLPDSRKCISPPTQSVLPRNIPLEDTRLGNIVDDGSNKRPIHPPAEGDGGYYYFSIGIADTADTTVKTEDDCNRRLSTHPFEVEDNIDIPMAAADMAWEAGKKSADVLSTYPLQDRRSGYCGDNMTDTDSETDTVRPSLPLEGCATLAPQSGGAIVNEHDEGSGLSADVPNDDLIGVDMTYPQSTGNNTQHADFFQPHSPRFTAGPCEPGPQHNSSSAPSNQSARSRSRSTQTSKATTPTDMDADGAREKNMANKTAAATSFDVRRRRFAVNPKSSIPKDIRPHQYAGKCVEAAESCRLSPYALHPDEYQLLRDHISYGQVTTYLNIRNSILRLWIGNPRAAVTRERAVGCSSARWFDTASVCYDFLVRKGYINFGCVEPAEAATSIDDTSTGRTRGRRRRRRRRRIVVIGAGMSGLGCARQLENLFAHFAEAFVAQGELPPEVVVLEGRRRIGGRVYSRELESQPASRVSPPPPYPSQRHTTEMGGMIITGFERGNPMNVLVRGQLGLPYIALEPQTTIYDFDGKPVDPDRDLLVERLYNDCLDRVSEYKFKLRPAKLIEGNRGLMKEGRDGVGDGHRSISQMEKAKAALPDAPSVADQNVPARLNLVPVSSDKLTGRVHNEPGMPATVRAAQKLKDMGWTLKDDASGGDNISLNGAAARHGATLGSVLDDAIEQFPRMVDLTALDRRLLNWHIANLEYSNATNLHNLSLGGWDMDAGNEWEGHHAMIVGGYQSVPRGLRLHPTPLNVRTSSPVVGIDYSPGQAVGPAEVRCEDGSTVSADCVVCTVPLGVLKHDSISYRPGLPAWKRDPISRLGFDVLNKVILVYKEPFWDQSRHIFGVLRPEPPGQQSLRQPDYARLRGRFFQWFNVSAPSGLPCLMALMAGDAGFETEQSSTDDLVREATGVLRTVFGRDVPLPVEAVVTRWAADRFARGSYSSAGPEMQTGDYDSMARPVGNLYFAGEHTIGTHPATVHGAYLSGLRAASEVLEALIGPIQIPTPLVLPKEPAVAKRKPKQQQQQQQSDEDDQGQGQGQDHDDHGHNHNHNHDQQRAARDAYESGVWEYICARIGDRPVSPPRVTVTSYILFSKDHFETAKRQCREAGHRAGRGRPRDVRVATARMWKQATEGERRPYVERAAERKKAHAAAIREFGEKAARWDEEAERLRAAYVREHPAPREAEAEDLLAGRRAKQVNYRESNESDVDA